MHITKGFVQLGHDVEAIIGRAYPGFGFGGLNSAFIFCTFIFLLYSCDLCVNTEIKRVTSPNGKKDFVLFVRDCGATTNFSLQGSILKKGKPLPKSTGNAIIMGSENYYPDTTVTLYPTWENNQTVSINCAIKPKILRLEKIMGVTITITKKASDRTSPPTSFVKHNTTDSVSTFVPSMPADDGKFEGTLVIENGAYTYRSRIVYDDITQLETIRFEVDDNTIKGKGSGKTDMDDMTWSFECKGVFIDSITCVLNMMYYPEDNKNNSQPGKEKWIILTDTLKRFNEYEKVGNYIRVNN